MNDENTLKEERFYFTLTASQASDWAKMGEYDDLVKAYQYYYDKWNWRSGDPNDRDVFLILEAEIKHRDKERQAIDEFLSEITKHGDGGLIIADMFNNRIRQEKMNENRREHLNKHLEEISDGMDET